MDYLAIFDVCQAHICIYFHIILSRQPSNDFNVVDAYEGDFSFLSRRCFSMGEFAFNGSQFFAYKYEIITR